MGSGKFSERVLNLTAHIIYIYHTDQLRCLMFGTHSAFMAVFCVLDASAVENLSGPMCTSGVCSFLGSTAPTKL